MRLKRGLSMDKLAALIGREKPLIYRLEHGFARYNESTLKALAEALGVQPFELLENDGAPMRGMAEDAVPYDMQDDGKSLPALKNTEFAYVVSTATLDQIGILPGDVLIIDTGTERLRRLKDGDVVIAQICDDDHLARRFCCRTAQAWTFPDPSGARRRGDKRRHGLLASHPRLKLIHRQIAGHSPAQGRTQGIFRPNRALYVTYVTFLLTLRLTFVSNSDTFRLRSNRRFSCRTPHTAS